MAVYLHFDRLKRMSPQRKWTPNLSWMKCLASEAFLSDVPQQKLTRHWSCSIPIARNLCLFTSVESEEHKNDVEDMEDVIEDLHVEKHVEVIEGTSEYEDTITLRRAKTQSDTIIDQSETLIGKDFIEDLDVKQAVEQLQRTPESQNRLQIPRTILKPEAVKEHDCFQ
ncbi:unnamed protein product [Cyprideis torosa]|uniref:Uncharacterized protein n=1 Tax=Cyprideis torosa TaxID=163714 RepID=A0A7R8ZPL4_9CRUS|nr:unnamed protein product [Cyprideis torosa]CAG0899152.1 unnamed protein product [Cyprideis torosa]